MGEVIKSIGPHSYSLLNIRKAFSENIEGIIVLFKTEKISLFIGELCEIFLDAEMKITFIFSCYIFRDIVGNSIQKHITFLSVYKSTETTIPKK